MKELKTALNDIELHTTSSKWTIVLIWIPSEVSAEFQWITTVPLVTFSKLDLHSAKLGKVFAGRWGAQGQSIRSLMMPMEQVWTRLSHKILTSSSSSLTSTKYAQNLGVIFDDKLNFSDHVASVLRSCRFTLYSNRKIRPYPTQNSTQLIPTIPIMQYELFALFPGT